MTYAQNFISLFQQSWRKVFANTTVNSDSTKYYSTMKNEHISVVNEVEGAQQLQILRSVYSMLDKLPEKKREIFIKSRLQGKTNIRIAEEYLISVREVEEAIEMVSSNLK